MGSLSLFAKNFTSYLPPGRHVDPMEDVAVVDGTVLHMDISNDPIPTSSPEFGVNLRGKGSLQHLLRFKGLVSSPQ